MRATTLSRQWAAAFHAHPDRPDGIFYPSRLNEERCAAIFDRALAKLKPLATPALLGCRSELASIPNDLEIAIR